MRQPVLRCAARVRAARASGYRLVYQVRDEGVMVYAIAVGKREKLAVYRNVHKRL
ncbi:type II toxin-antitoxin system RelE/ParE family toxin [Klebsiella michiganensis]|nr:type II toxin-antitoxin system RelE/ParE family toxin [Klebsiella michiganensis]QET48741.1 hypothetical protein FOB55_12165 [Klebsiella michiganensis]QUG46169.1 type II toxin-antitoxin system RelE/ParE family toxin [Klebsiella michiganensis]HBM3088826.1 type II toxin-antitoxin system RelE/ParE family toxin [Klebsiella michiganensis]HDS9720309.1 type II toxin-antitoxin system RelE/ParE family toxin [Klebsiella michiganensis]